MVSDLVVAGMAERTQEAYLRAVRLLSKFYNNADPATLTEEQVKDYMLWVRHERRAARGTLKIMIGGLRFFYRRTCGLDWKVLERFASLARRSFRPSPPSPKSDASSPPFASHDFMRTS